MELQSGNIREKVGKSIMLTRQNVPESIKEQGCRISTSADELIVAVNSGDGLFYGTQTVLQLIQIARNGFRVADMKITDWPDIEISDKSNMEETIELFRKGWETDWTYFSTGNEMELRHVNGVFNGLDLDENLLKKIYTENALK